MCLMRFPSSCEMKMGCQPYKLSAHSIQNPLFCFHPRDIRKNRFSHISGMNVLKHKKYIKLIKFHTPDQVYTVFTIYTRSGIIISPRCGSEYVGPVRLTALHPAAPCPAATCTRRYPGCRVFVSAKVSLSFKLSEYLPPISHAGVPLILFLLLLRFLVRSAIFLSQYSVTQTNTSSRSSLPLIILKWMF